MQASGNIFEKDDWIGIYCDQLEPEQLEEDEPEINDGAPGIMAFVNLGENLVPKISFMGVYRNREIDASNNEWLFQYESESMFDKAPKVTVASN